MLSSETKDALTIILAVGGGGGGLVYIVLLAVLYFRLTRKYDAIFPNHERMIPLPATVGTIVRTGCYAWCIVFKNFTKYKRNKRIYQVTGDYNFRVNASTTDIILSYLFLFSLVCFLFSAITFYVIHKIFSIEL